MASVEREKGIMLAPVNRHRQVMCSTDSENSDWYRYPIELNISIRFRNTAETNSLFQQFGIGRCHGITGSGVLVLNRGSTLIPLRKLTNCIYALQPETQKTVVRNSPELCGLQGMYFMLYPRSEREARESPHIIAAAIGWSGSARFAANARNPSPPNKIIVKAEN
ncbi:hypothetical protein K445DRAFT_13428 [Daldinia sp. EC12]|nr:hypothetical protein K445DRAFT_13428 [Daldinia sp. EC12]